MIARAAVVFIAILTSLPDIDNGFDLDEDGVADCFDNCALFNPEQLDCQPNDSGDVCDLADGTSSDMNGNSIPDECECPADLNRDGQTDAADLALLLGGWGACPDCAADLTGDGQVDAADLAILLGNWGPCL